MNTYVVARYKSQKSFGFNPLASVVAQVKRRSVCDALTLALRHFFELDRSRAQPFTRSASRTQPRPVIHWHGRGEFGTIR